ncbi:MAG: hypothetical protein ACSHXD_17090 [Marinosulfonomonas sp.]
MFILLRKITFSFVFVVTLLAGPAMADITAVYADLDDLVQKLIIEISNDGEVRVSDTNRSYYEEFLFLDPQGYALSPGPGGPIATTLDAYKEELRQEEERSIRIPAETATEGGSAKTSKPPALNYVAAQKETVIGFEGFRYDVANTDDPDIEKAILTDALSLVPLGQAFAAYRKVFAQYRQRPESNLDGLLATNGVLQLGKYRLASVSYAKIDPSRFWVPADPITFEDVKRPPKPANSKATYEPGPRPPFVFRAGFDGSTLYTLMSDDRLLAWPDGGQSGTEIEMPPDAWGMCVHDGTVYVTSYTEDPSEVLLWARASEKWSKVLEIRQTPSDSLIAFDCSGPQPALLSSKAIRTPMGQSEFKRLLGFSWSFIEPDMDHFSIISSTKVTLQHGGYMYIGTNAGEWGGGLTRYSLKTGKPKTIQGPKTKELCGRLLDDGCSPVTGLGVDPQNPKCILATVGLVHFSPSGAVYRICGDRISIAYAKPYTLDPKWVFDPDDLSNTGNSIAFYSLDGDEKGQWAVASDGVYRFGAKGEIEHVAFPENSQMPKSGVDWSNPDYILIRTTMNQAFSLSGESLILVAG